MIDRFACGSFAVTVGAQETTLMTATCEGRFTFVVDASAMVAGDVAYACVYAVTLTGGTRRAIDSEFMYGVRPQNEVTVRMGPYENDLVGEANAIQLTLTQPCGTSRTFPVKGLRDTEQIPITEPRAVFTWPACARDILAWTGAIGTNCIAQSTTQQGVCSRDRSIRIGVAEISSAASVTVRGTFS